MGALNLQDNEKLVILWASGNISSQFLKEWPIQKAINESKLAALLTSEKVLSNLNWIKWLTINKIIEPKSKEERRDVINSKWCYNYQNKWWIIGEIEYLEWKWIKPVIIDLSNWDLTEEHKYLIENWHKVIWANKIPLATSSFEDFQSMVWKNYWAESTVMWGQWIYWAVESNFNAWIEIQQIEWVFSGTMWYIMSELEKWRKFSDIIKEAIELKYTETNPMDDLDWLDVAKKIVILARRAGNNISIEDVEINWLLDDSYREFFNEWVTEESIQAFLEKIKKEEDPKYEELVKKAKEDKKVLRYLAQFVNEDWQLKTGVNIQEVLKSSQLWWLSWPANIATMQTSIQTSTIIWPWAGVEVTSSNVLKNLYQILNNR